MTEGTGECHHNSLTYVKTDTAMTAQHEHCLETHTEEKYPGHLDHVNHSSGGPCGW